MDPDTLSSATITPTERSLGYPMDLQHLSGKGLEGLDWGGVVWEMMEMVVQGKVFIRAWTADAAKRPNT